MYAAPYPMLQNQTTSQHSQSQRPDITHAWNDVKQPVIKSKNNSCNRYLRPLSREDVVASINATKKRYADQKAQGLTPDNHQVFVRVRSPEKSLWGSLKEGVTYMATRLNEGVRQLDFLPDLPFSMAYGMPSSEKRGASSDDEAMKQALVSVYEKLERADYLVKDLRDSIVNLRKQIDDARNKPPVPAPTCTSPSDNATTTLPAGVVSYEHFRKHAESLGFQVEIWNPVSHDVCDTTCNLLTPAWTGPSNTIVSIDGLPIILNRNQPDKMFLLLQEFVRPNDQIITTDERFGLNEECLNLVKAKNCVSVTRICSNMFPDTIQPVRSQIGTKNTRVFVDFNEREQNSLIENFINRKNAVPFIRVKYVGSNDNAANTTHSLALNKLDLADDAVTFLEFLQYAETLGMKSDLSYAAFFFDPRNVACRDTFNIRTTLLHEVPIIVSRLDPEKSLNILKAFVRPGDVIITTNSDFSTISKCLGLVQESACITQSSYCASIQSADNIQNTKEAWLNIATGWAKTIKTAMEAEPRRRIFIDLGQREQRVLMSAYVRGTSNSDFSWMQMAAVAPDGLGGYGIFIPERDGPSCPIQPQSQTPVPSTPSEGTAPNPVSTEQTTPKASDVSGDLAVTLGAVLGTLAIISSAAGGIYWYTKKGQGEEQKGDLSKVVVEDDDGQYEMRSQKNQDDRVENDEDNRT